MNISNFENHINKTILDRGYDYYIEGNIIDTYCQDDNIYVFEVEGSEDYEVVVKIDENGEILYSECDCPYDFGPICKHQVAAFFELFEIYNKKSDGKKEIIKQPDIEEVLNNFSKEELINIILDITNKESALKNSIIFRYSKGDDNQELEKCKKLIDSIVRNFTRGSNFISYRETYEFTNEMGTVLDKARHIYEVSNKPLLALEITLILLEESIESYQYTDDSDGEIGDFVSAIMELIEEIVSGTKVLDKDTREKIFNKMLKQIDSVVFNGWEEYRVDLIAMCSEFADVEEFRNKLKMKIQYLVNKNRNDDYKEYTNERLMFTLFHIIDECGDKEEAERFIKENLKYSSFRELYIDKFMKEKNYLKVIELAQEGEIKDKQFAGLVSRIEKI